MEEGLSRLLAFLREEEERERLEEIERLKPIGTPVGGYLEYRWALGPGAGTQHKELVLTSESQ